MDPTKNDKASKNAGFIYYSKKINYETFFNDNLEENKPCVFGPWLIENWTAAKDWVSCDGTPNIQYLLKFGESSVPVADCKSRHFNANEKETFIFKDYLRYFEHQESDQRCLYLKDWHFRKAFPHYEAYSTPEFFGNDWLNEFWSQRNDLEDDYRFVYIGPKGSWTPFHSDVFNSYSWSTNICGKKRWVLFPPKDVQYLKSRLGDLPYDIESEEFSDIEKYPNVSLIEDRIEVILGRGETIFVPSGWHHQVWNMEDTISINHNWINGTNISDVLDFFLKSLGEVEKSIDDCREMDGWASQCQLILKSVHGMDATELVQFLLAIAHRRLSYLKGDESISSFPEVKFSKDQVLYDSSKLVFAFEYLLNKLPSEVIDSLQEKDECLDVVNQLKAAI